MNEGHSLSRWSQLFASDVGRRSRLSKIPLATSHLIRLELIRMSYFFSSSFALILAAFVFLVPIEAFQSTCLVSRFHQNVPIRRKVYTWSQSDARKEFDELGISERRIVEVERSIILPFSAEIAYDAYSDLPRQPSWSSWLYSVEWMDASTTVSKWTLKFLGFKYSWTATSLKNERPHTIQWKSTSGLANFGTVEFEEIDQERTIMTLTMTLAAPRAVAVLFNKSKRLSEFVERKMISTSLDSFREVVLQTDVKTKV
eukprot:scaffold517_cov119-Cylindrotheca_fusiformis.AAC.15